MPIAYLLNQFPLPSTTFIRREIRALEALGVEIHRFAARPSPVKLVDPQDIEDESRTDYLLKTPKPRLLLDTLRTALNSPARFLSALRLTWTLSRRSNRGLIAHLAYFVEACTLLRRCRRKNIEHIHAHFSTNPAAIACICRELGGPTYSFTVHGPHEFDAPESLSLDIKAVRAKFVAAISHYTRSQLFRWIPREHWEKIHIVRCGVSEKFLNHPLTPVPDANRFVSIGRLSEQKGQLVLVDAVRILRDRGIDIQLDLIGGGELEPVLRAEITRHNLQDRIHLLGWQTEDQIITALLSSRAMVLPSFAEGLPVVIMEALALGRPVISTYIAGIPELVTPGESGWLTPAGNASTLADTVEQCLHTDPSTLNRIGKHGALAVFHRHHAKTEARKILTFASSSLQPPGAGETATTVSSSPTIRHAATTMPHPP